MIKIYSLVRYIVFGLLIACNAVLASVTVWNFSLAQIAKISFPVEPYLIFVSISGLILTFTLIFIQLFRRNAISVWLECTWSGTFLVLQLAGAAAVSGTTPVEMCSRRLNKIVQLKGTCVSTQVVLAFSWISTVIVFAYFVLILITALLLRRQRSSVWSCSINNFPGSESQRLGSAPSSPTLPRFVSTAAPASIIAPRPQRPAVDLLQTYHSGLSPDYRIEHFQLPKPPPPVTVSQQTRQMSHPFSSFYSQAVQSELGRQGQIHQPSLNARTVPPSRSPPPLGNWPRVDVMKQPISVRPNRQSRTHTAQLSLPSAAALDRSVRPGGPRKRSASGGNLRPPPLDLSKISAFNNLPQT
jgi:hypothetical protein